MYNTKAFLEKNKRSAPKRNTYPVLNQIRYCFMPPIMLKKIRGEELQEMPHFIDILKEFSKSPGVVQHLRDAVFESSLLISVRNDPSVLKTQVEFKEVKIKESRHWIQDHTCAYHRQVTPLCPNMHFITLKEYQDYLKRLTLGPEFNACLEYTEDGKSEEPQDS
ncbi:GM22577 [Drosophila sechellia]|uniref:GM22577 n=1 Tax=Drosophila sechellia TaxID=7238 RepID=B4IKC4_DROSE|nr:GM22577 [Drosophila sechellia]